METLHCFPSLVSDNTDYFKTRNIPIPISLSFSHQIYGYLSDFPYIDNEGNMQVAKLFIVEIDLSTKKMINCRMDEDFLSASEAVILLYFNTVSAQHVKIHAYANWGTNVEDEVKEVNHFLHRNSVVSVAYNFFGFSMFPRSFDTWKKQGLLSKEWDPDALKEVFLHGLKENIPEHSHIVELVPHSELVHFLTKIRSIFHIEFAKYKHMFPGVNAEALFIGTILHSVDHAMAEWNLKDPLWLDVTDPRFGKMAEMGRIVRAGFIPEVPGFYFHRYFRGSGHPFYESVYAKAAAINKELADQMDSCICR